MTLKSDAIPITSIPHSETTGQTSTDHHGAVDLVTDTTPQLGGNLDANGHDVTGMGHIVFLATQDASADANAMDDYEEGSFDPSVGDNSGDGTGEGQVYSVRVGVYTKIGNRVFFECHVIITDLGTLTTSQQTRILGLPFTANGLTNGDAGGVCTLADSLVLPNASENVQVRINPGTAYLALRNWDATSGSSPLLISEFSVGANVAFSGHYRI